MSISTMMRAALTSFVCCVLLLGVPTSDAFAQSPAPAEPAPSSSAQVPRADVITHKGQQIRARLDQATSTMLIELNGKEIARVPNIDQMGKPNLLPGTRLSAVSIWTQNAAKTCAQQVLVAFPTAGTGRAAAHPAAPHPAEVKTGFGRCNTKTQQTSLKRGAWELWAVIAFPAAPGSPDADVSVAAAGADGKLVISEQRWKPCLVSPNAVERTVCGEQYIAAALGSEVRGIPSGEAAMGAQRLATFQNRADTTGSIELNGKPYKTFAGVTMFHAEPAANLDGTTLFSIWMQPTDSACGHRMFLVVPPGATDAGPGIDVLHRVGTCRPKNITQSQHGPDGKLRAWSKIMWRDGDPRVDVATWRGGGIELKSVRVEACFWAAPAAGSDCIAAVLAAPALPDDDALSLPRSTPEPSRRPPPVRATPPRPSPDCRKGETCL
jgi:hypothetical protein